MTPDKPKSPARPPRPPGPKTPTAPPKVPWVEGKARALTDRAEAALARLQAAVRESPPVWQAAAASLWAGVTEELHAAHAAKDLAGVRRAVEGCECVASAVEKNARSFDPPTIGNAAHWPNPTIVKRVAKGKKRRRSQQREVFE
jgi:hypothetical protein